MKGKTMTDIKHINGLYKEHGAALERKYAFINELETTYNIPTEDIARYLDLDMKVTTTWERYWNSLSMPWWETLWCKLTNRK
jgi:hypothetical protein